MLMTLFSFLSVFMVSLVVLLTVFSSERKVKKRLSQLDIYGIQQTVASVDDDPFYERVTKPFIDSAARFINHFSPVGMVDGIKKRLAYAGNPNGLNVDKFISFKVLFIFAATVCFIFLFILPGFSKSKILFLAMFVIPFSFFVPDLWLANRIEKRQKAIRLALPDTLDLLTISVEAGLAFDAAISKVIKHGIGPLGDEFAKMLQAMQVGASRKDALKELASRTNVSELHNFIISIIQADVFGIGISRVLKTQAKEMREKRRQYAEERAMKAPVKIVFPVVLCIFPALMVVIIGPALIRAINVFSVLP